MKATRMLTALCCCCAAWVFVASTRAADPAAAPAARPDPAAERLTFLTLQLSSTEESIKAINAALKVAGYKAAVAEDRAATAEKGNELMDRKGGAPVPWDQFYGRTARDFIAPAPAGKWAVLHKGPGQITYPTNDPLKRPEQFDYLYRANSEQAAKAKQQAAALGRKVDALLARRRQLEAEQVGLWGAVALEMIGNREIASRPLYRFKLKGAGDKAADAARAEIVRAAALFLRTADRTAAQAVDRVSSDPAGALQLLKERIPPAEDVLRDAVTAQQDAAATAPAQGQQVKDLLRVAKRMQLLCRNVTDAYRLALDGDAAGDESRKQMFRGQLQESLLSLADATGEMDGAVTGLAAAWDVRDEVGVDAGYALPAAPAARVTPPKETSPTAVTPAAAPTATSAATPAAPAVGAAITVTASTRVNVLALERGAPRLYDSNPLRRIEGVDGSLGGWQFLSIPQRVVIQYAVHVNKPGTLYAFGKQGDFDQIFGRDRAKWEPAGGSITGKMVSFAFRRRVSPGEDIALGGFEIQLAAESIDLGTGGVGTSPRR